SAAAKIMSGVARSCASSIRHALFFFPPAMSNYRRGSLRTGSSRTNSRYASRFSYTNICGAMSLENKKAVVLLSGGLDSATTLAIARSQSFECHALSVDYGQRHAAELDAAMRVSGV